MTKSIILLSGGLDSATSLALLANEKKQILSLFFDYGQKGMEYEKIAAEKLAQYYNSEFQLIKLDWLKNITKTSLVNVEKDVPEADIYELDNDASSKSLWIPNRNGVFINIAGAFADSFGYDEIVIGANKEEARSFKDNSEDFLNKIETSLKFSTNVNVKVYSPLIKMNKSDIILLGKKLNLPFNLIRSCYNEMPYHCGKCESCLRLKRALDTIEDTLIKKELFAQE